MDIVQVVTVFLEHQILKDPRIDDREAESFYVLMMTVDGSWQWFQVRVVQHSPRAHLNCD